MDWRHPVGLDVRFHLLVGSFIRDINDGSSDSLKSVVLKFVKLYLLKSRLCNGRDRLVSCCSSPEANSCFLKVFEAKFRDV